MADYNWTKIKKEYITSDTASYTTLAKKYGVARSAIAHRAGKERWVEQKERYRNELITKTVEAMQEKQLDKMKRIQDATDRLLTKLEQAIDDLDRQIVRDVTKTKVIEYNNEMRPDKPTKETIEEHEEVKDVSTIIDRAGIKAIASALRDIKEIQMLKSDLDQKEQEARIAKLQKDATVEDKTVDITVTFGSDAEEYSG